MCNGMMGLSGISSPSGRFGNGQAINRLCGSLDDPAERARFYANEDAYCLQFGLSREERQAIKDRDYVTLVKMGGYVAKLDKLAALSGLSTVEAIKKRTGLSANSFMLKLLQGELG